MKKFPYIIRNNHMHTVVLIFVGGFCLGLIAFGIQVLNSPVSTDINNQKTQSIIGVLLIILGVIGYILIQIYHTLNYRFYAKKDWGGIELQGNNLSYRFFNHWRFIEKTLDISALTSVFVHTHKGQACIQLTTNSPLQISEIPCKHLSNEDLNDLIMLLNKNESNTDL